MIAQLNHVLHAVSKTIRFCIAVFSEATHLLQRMASNRRVIQKSNIDDILIFVPSHGPGLGDLIQFKSVIAKINEEWSDVQLHLVINKPQAYRDVFADDHLFDSTLFFQQKDTLREQVEILRQVRQLDADLLLMEFHSISFSSSLISLFSGIPYRIGHASSAKIPVIWSYAFNYPVRLEDDAHRISQYGDLLAPLSIDINIHRSPQLMRTDQCVSRAKTYLNAHGVQAPYITIAPGSGSQTWKRWGREQFALLSDQLIENLETNIVFVGSAGERELIEEIQSAMKCQSICSAGDLTIKEAAAVIEKSRMLICNSCGLMHVADAVGTPIFAIYGPIYRNAFPPGEKNRMIQKLYPDEPIFDDYWDHGFYVKRRSARRGIDDLTVDEVFSRIMVSDIWTGDVKKP